MNYVSLIMRYILMVAVTFALLTFIPRTNLAQSEKLILTVALIVAYMLLDLVDPYVQSFSAWICGCKQSTSDIEIDI